MELLTLVLSFEVVPHPPKIFLDLSWKMLLMNKIINLDQSLIVVTHWYSCVTKTRLHRLWCKLIFFHQNYEILLQKKVESFDRREGCRSFTRRSLIREYWASIGNMRYKNVAEKLQLIGRSYRFPYWPSQELDL